MARAFWDTPVSERIVQIPGYGPGHVYPLSRPNLRTARRLAGSQRRRAVLLIAVRPRTLSGGDGAQVEPRAGSESRCGSSTTAAATRATVASRVPQGRHDHRHELAVRPLRARPRYRSSKACSSTASGERRSPPGRGAAPAFRRQLRACRAAPRPSAHRGVHAARRRARSLSRQSSCTDRSSTASTSARGSAASASHRSRQGVDFGSLCVTKT